MLWIGIGIGVVIGAALAVAAGAIWILKEDAEHNAPTGWRGLH